MSATTSETILKLQTALIGVAVTILIAGIPWAYSLHGRVSAVEVTSEATSDMMGVALGELRMAANAQERINSLERRIDALERWRDREDKTP